jgi:hypothetical protein
MKVKKEEKHGDSVLSGGEGIDAERYYTIKEAAWLLRRHEKTV